MHKTSDGFVLFIYFVLFFGFYLRGLTGGVEWVVCGTGGVPLAVQKTVFIGTRRRSAPVSHISFG